MPIDYKKYPKNWKTEIRPAIIERAKNRCELCRIKNNISIERGFYNGVEAYQDYSDNEGDIFRADNSKYITSDYLGSLDRPSGKIITIVLTIAHLDHDLNNNDYSNLKSLCQRCHLNHDKMHHLKNRRQTIKNKKGLIEIDF